jgi:hypothetical protein
MERRVEHQLPDVLAVDHPAVRRVVPAVAVWVDLSALTGRARGDWRHSGMNVTTVAGLLTGWIRTLGNGWLAVVDVVLPIESRPAATSRVIVPASAVTRDSFQVRKRMGLYRS